MTLDLPSIEPATLGGSSGDPSQSKKEQTFSGAFARLRSGLLVGRDRSGHEKEPAPVIAPEQEPEAQGAQAPEADGAPEKEAAPEKEGAAKKPAGLRYDVLAAGSAIALAATAGAWALWPQGSRPPVMEKGLESGELMAPAAKLAGIPVAQRQGVVVEVPDEEAPGKAAEEVATLWSGGDGKTPAAAAASSAPASVAPPAPPAQAPGAGRGEDARRSAPAEAAKETKKPADALGAATGVARTVEPGPNVKAEDGRRAVSSPAEPPSKSETVLEQETKLYSMITELSTLVRRTREELAGVQDANKKLAKAIDAKLNDFERRLNLGEAQRALEAAKATPTAPPEQTNPPAAASPSKPASGTRNVVSAALSTDASAGGSAPVARYRVQAASPGLAMLSEIDRSGEEISPLQIAIGTHVPGYGKVTKISQRGTEWVVQTEKGPIR